jgi:hypothetical protein
MISFIFCVVDYSVEYTWFIRVNRTHYAPVPKKVTRHEMHAWPLVRTTIPNPKRDLSNNALEAALVPLDNLLLGDAVGGTDLGLASSTLGNTVTWASPVVCISIFCPPLGNCV